MGTFVEGIWKPMKGQSADILIIYCNSHSAGCFVCACVKDPFSPGSNMNSGLRFLRVCAVRYFVISENAYARKTHFAKIIPGVCFLELSEEFSKDSKNECRISQGKRTIGVQVNGFTVLGKSGQSKQCRTRRLI